MAYTWNVGAARFRDESGRFVARSTVRHGLDETLRSAAAEVVTLSERLQAGTIALAEWRAEMAREVKNAHLAAATLAKGGWAQMTPADYGRAGAVIKEQYGLLGQFAAQIESGEQLMTGVANRSSLYLEAARPTYHAVERREMQVRNVAEERSVLGFADHCAECIEQAELGWQPLGEMVPIGSRECGPRCACETDFRGSTD